MARILKADKFSYTQAISLLQAGAPVALPTETVYGLAALAFDDAAVADIYSIKSRPKSKPLSVVVSGLEATAKIARISPLARALAETFWPGPLTLVLPLHKSAPISPLALAHGKTIGVRCPDIPWMAYFGKAGFNEPLVLPSANRSGRPAPTNAKDVNQDIGDKIDLIIDGGQCKTGIESTIIAVENDSARILRRGAIKPESFAPFRIDWN